jgi:autotransporter adhesin
LQFVTADANGNLATANLPAGFDPASLSNSINNLQTQISGLTYLVNKTKDAAYSGTAVSMAAAGLHYDDTPGAVSLAAGMGGYKGKTAVAAGVGYNPMPNLRVQASFSAAPSGHDYGWNVGGTWRLW